MKLYVSEQFLIHLSLLEKYLCKELRSPLHPFFSLAIIFNYSSFHLSVLVKRKFCYTIRWLIRLLERGNLLLNKEIYIPKNFV